VGAAVAVGIGFSFAGAATPEPRQLSDPSAFADPSRPSEPRDTGIGERLLLVFGGSFATKEEARGANARYRKTFGELQGYYVVPVAAYAGLREVAGGEWALVSAFRTRAGAEDFAAFARSLDVPAEIIGPFISEGGPYAGLGQEAAPDGRGPLEHALSAEQQAALT
jgi:hypothetical protein